LGKKYLTIAVFCILAVTRTFAQSALEFVENKGQWDKSVRFKGSLNSGAFFLQNKGFIVLQHNPEDLRNLMDAAHRFEGAIKEARFDNGKGKMPILNTPAKRVLHSHAYAVKFEGANENPQAIPEKVTEGTFNYLLGNDPSKWASNVKSFQAVVYKNLYPGIDIRYYSENGHLKYDLVVNPGADPNKILMRYEGADKLLIKNKELVVKTSVGDVKELYPYSFQFNPTKGRREVQTSFQLVGNDGVKFSLKNYDRNSTLIIDPTVVFSSFTGSPVNQYGFTATPGPDGSFYSGGIVFADGFPTTMGAFQSNFQGGTGSGPTDMAIMKFSPNGSQRVYATYIGGGENDYPHSLFCDPQGNLVVMGRSYSVNYPGTQEGSGGGADIVVTKLNSTGTGIIGSIRIGGDGNDGVNIFDMQSSGNAAPSSLMQNYGDDSRSEVVLDGSGNIYVAAQTQSGTTFPMRGNGFQKAGGGKQDGVIMKINPTCTNVIWTSFLGGAEDDGAFVLDLHPFNGDIYVGGSTSSANFPGNKAGTIGGSFVGGPADGFTAVISNDGTTLRRSTFLGTSGIDIVYGIQFDRLGYPYIMGVTRGNWPVINATYSNPNSKQFIAKLEPDLSKYIYSTVFGSGSPKPNMSPVAFLVDRCENVYISGWGGWIDDSSDPFDMAGVAGMPVTSDARKTITDNKDFYFFVLKKNATDILYGSFFGQDGAEGEHVDGGTSRFDAQGVIYQAICANCGGQANYPTTPGVVGPVNGTGSRGCNLAALKISFNFAGVAAGPKSFVNGVPDSTGCAPFTVQLRDTVLNAKTYEWRFGDGTPDVVTDQFEITHTFTNVGTYVVRLIAIDSTTCNIRDTSYLTIKAGNNRGNVAFAATKLPPCESLSYRFDNTSTAPAALPFAGNDFIWDFGDGSARVVAPYGPVTHSFLFPGTYNVRLILTDTAYCNAPDSVTQVLRIAPLVEARFETPPAGCAPYDAVFTNTSLAGQTFTWDFGDGTTSTDVNPVHSYPVPGNYDVRLTAVDPNTCNGTDDTTFTLVVSDKPTADFSFTPVPAIENKPTIFTNLSLNGVQYKWLFGDGDSTVKTTMDTVYHQYNVTGIYQACLVTYNQYGCTDTICKPVQAIITPLLDVPNAFTPGRFGKNSVIRVEGFGIARMSWKIYNRWGQAVFESADFKHGWDGTYKGQLQPMDVYAYTLDVEFTDGTKTRKTGDITLIR
jgi:gliding motility-associated-like protein